MSETAVIPPRRPLSNKGHPRVAKEVSQTIELQRDAFKLAKNAEEPMVRLRAMAEFRSLGDWRRVLRNKPLPGSLRPDGQPSVKNYRDRPRKRDYIAAAAAQVEADAKAVIEEVQR